MGTIISKSKKYNKNNESCNKKLLDYYDHNNDNSDDNNVINIKTLIETLKFEVIKLKEDNQKIKVEVKSLRDKNERIESEISKIQNNHGKEIFALNEAFSSLQKDTITLINNQKIISEVLHKISDDNNYNQSSIINHNIGNSFYNSINNK